LQGRVTRAVTCPFFVCPTACGPSEPIHICRPPPWFRRLTSMFPAERAHDPASFRAASWRTLTMTYDPYRNNEPPHDPYRRYRTEDRTSAGAAILLGALLL